MAKFRSKPVEIEAFQLTREFLEAALFDGNTLPNGVRFSGASSPTGRTFSGLVLCTSNHGQVPAAIDDWIISEPNAPGLCYPCRPDVFALKYEPVG